MLSQTIFRLREISRRIWVRAMLISILAVLAAFAAPLVAAILPEMLRVGIDVGKTRSLLDILANSMLAVTTFSLTVMVSAHLHAADLASPRAHRILVQDARTQTVLSTFVGTFVFALVGIVMIQLGFLDEATVTTLYLMTLVVTAFVVVTILRWIAHLARLGSIEETTRRVQRQTRTALETRFGTPFMGGMRFDLEKGLPDSGHDIAATGPGFVQHVDIAAISKCAGDEGGSFYLFVSPGDWVGTGERLGRFDGDHMTSDLEAKFCDAFTLGDVRDFDQDVAFGYRVMAEIAERALSPGINDPRTATDVIARLVTLTEGWTDETPSGEPTAPNVYVPAIDAYKVLRMGFDPISRDGRTFAEVHRHLQRAFRRLAQHRNRDVARAARVLSSRALAYAEMGIPLESDLAALRQMAVADVVETWKAPAARAGAEDDPGARPDPA